MFIVVILFMGICVSYLNGLVVTAVANLADAFTVVFVHFVLVLWVLDVFPGRRLHG
jgi:hypothetical protein